MAVINMFMPQPTSMSNANSWQCRVIPKQDYDRTLFPDGYISSATELVVFWIRS